MYIIKRPSQWFNIKEVGDGPECLAGSCRYDDSLLCFDNEDRAHYMAMMVPVWVQNLFRSMSCEFLAILLREVTVS